MNLRHPFGALFSACVMASPALWAADSKPASEEAHFLSNARQLTFEGRRSGEGYFSQDGKALVFQSEREPGNPFYQIYMLDLETGDSHRISPGIGKTTCAYFRPGSDDLLFSSTHLDPEAAAKQKAEFELRASGKQRRYSWDYDEHMDIFLARRDGSNLRRLTSAPGYDAEASFSPDGKQIVFCSLRDAYPTNKLSETELKHFQTDPAWFGEIYLMDADGSNVRRLTRTPGYELAWTSSRTAEGKSQIFLADWNDAAALEALAAAPLRRGSEGATEHVGISSQPTSSSGESRGETPTFSPAITTNDLHSIVSYLSSDELEGRLAGSRGAELAAEFIAAQMKRIGLQPVETNNGFFQSYQFNSGARVRTNANHLIAASPAGTTEFEVEKDFRPLAFTANAEVKGQVVFAGYGLSVPGKADEAYDSYGGIDVSNKLALVLRYVPEQVEPKRRAELNRYAGLRYKAMLARERGAKGVLFVIGPNSPNAGELLSLSSDSTIAGSDIAVASVSSNVATALLAGSGKDLGKLQTALDTENPHAESGFLLTNVHVSLATSVEHIRKTDRNVLGLLPAGGASGATGSEVIMLGAHYDHLGHGETGAMNRKGEEGLIHPGADDNASGVATVLELAGVLASERSKNPAAFSRGIIFATWAGEEIGVIGSSWFAEHPLLPLTNMVAYLNFDMVGRLRDNKLTLQGVGSSPDWTKLIEKRNVAAGFNLSLQDDPYLPTDTTSIYPKGVPVLAFFTGSHEDYHRPTDRPETLNYEGIRRVAQLARGIVVELEHSPRLAYARVAGAGDAGGGRETLRAYLGTIPDYASEVQGVKLSGVRADGPADKAGLKGGDIIIEFGGTRVANIYDYTYALDAVKIGKPVTVVVLRNGERVSLSVTPEARK